MPFLSRLSSLSRHFFQRQQREKELDEELRSVLELLTEQKMREGMSLEEARRAAKVELGGIEQVKESVREARTGAWLDTLGRDVRYGLRTLRKNPGFTATAVITLALGIGATTAIFSFLDAWLIKPLPYPQPDRLLVLLSHNEKQGWTSHGVTSNADFLDFQKQSTSFEQLAGWTQRDFSVTGGGPPVLVDGGQVTWNYFQTLAAEPLLGRTFTPEEDAPGAPHVAVISEGLWRSRFAGNPAIIGKDIAIGDEPYSVVGVMRGTFQFPLMGVANLWTPLALSEKERADHGSSSFMLFGRLKPGVTRAQAAAETAAIFAEYAKQYPQTNTNVTTLLSPMAVEIQSEEGAEEIAICLCVTGLILLIACVNVATLTLAKASRRVRELAVRGAFGATRQRLVRQLLTESLLLFLFGAATGTLFGLWGMRWIENAIPAHIRGYIVNYGHVSMDLTTLAFTLGITLVCGVAFGLVPAFGNSRIDINSVLKSASAQGSASRGHARLRRVFVSSEIGLAVVVLIVATLLVKSFVISMLASPGFNPAGVMTAQLELPATGYADDARLRNFADAVLGRLRVLPGVASAGVASGLPFGGFGRSVEIEAVGKPAPRPGEGLRSHFTAVSPDYLPTMEIELLKGREFTSADSSASAPVALINQTMARQLWPDEEPVGQELRFGDQHVVCTIVGVTSDIKMNSPREPPEPQMYVPLAQFPSQTLGFVARTATGNSKPTATAIRDAIWAVDSDQPISSVEQLDTLMAVVDTGNRILAELMLFFGVLATLLGAIGIFGVMAQTVAQRTREIGIRAALGAGPGRAMFSVLADGLRLTAIGVLVGIVVAFAAGRALASLLYGVAPNDSATFVGVPAVFALVAMLACWIPARRAMRVDPMVALRHE